MLLTHVNVIDMLGNCSVHRCFGSRCPVLRAQKLKSPLLRNYNWEMFSFDLWRRSECSYACFAYCQELPPRPNFDPPGPFTFISLQFFSLFLTAVNLGHTHTRTYARTDVHARAHTHARTHEHTHTHTHTHTLSFSLSHTHTWTRWINRTRWS